MRLLRHPAVAAAAPWTAALLTLATGVLLLASAATPSIPSRFIRLMEFEPAILIEISHFVSSVLGLVLVMLAFGLRARLDAAWAATLVTLLIAAPLSLVKGFVWEETALLLGLALALAPFHYAFPRKAALNRMEITPAWLFSAAAFVVGAGMIGLWSFQNADYGDLPWWEVMADLSSNLSEAMARLDATALGELRERAGHHLAHRPDCDGIAVDGLARVVLARPR